MGDANKVKSQVVLRTGQQGIPCYSTDLLTEKLLCRLPSLPTQHEMNFVWALLRSGFQVHSYIPPQPKRLKNFNSGSAVPSQDPVMPGDLQIQNKDSANPRKITL